MDYKEKYQEALERAKKGLPIDEVFPELKESEDERIRKWLYDYISNCPNNNFAFYGGVGKDAVLNYLEKRKEYVSDNFDDIWTTEDCAEIIKAGEKLSPRFKELFKEVCHAWYDKGIELEKQKEQKPKITDYEISLITNDEQSILKAVGDVYENIHNAMEQKQTEWSEEERIRNMLIEQMEHWHECALENNVVQDIKDSADAISWLEKQKKQKPSEKSLMLKKLREHLANTPKEQLDAEFEALKLLTIDKPAGWSEEDEKIFNSLCTVLHGGLSSIPTEKFISWLKSRLSQSKQELSDKDKEMFDKCIANAKKHIPIPDKNGHLAKIEERVDKELVDWLKKRFFNVHWKPSEEQIDALDDCVNRAREIYNTSASGYNAYPALRLLYNDIKKLM